MKATTDQIRAARRADLYDFLRRHHPDDVHVEGNSLRLKADHSVSVKRGYSGFRDFSTGATGNGIDLLVRYLGYSIPQAAEALAAGVPTPSTGVVATPPPRVVPITPPPKAANYRRIFAYLQQQRMIPADVIQRLVDEDLLYQAEQSNNAVFISRQKDFCELRGTLSQKPFHGVLKTQPDRFWSFQGSPIEYEGKPTAYICESAIDAISLYLVHRHHDMDTRAHYCSLGGAANYDTIKRIQRHARAILAVDQDHAGDLCRERFPDLPTFNSRKKDWNEEWITLS